MIIHTLYDGRIELGFNRDNHRYFWRKVKSEGTQIYDEWQRCPGVTDCLKSAASPGLEKWKIRCAVEYLQEWVAENADKYKDGDTEGLIIDEVEWGEACDDALTAHNKISRRGARIGSMAHRWVEKWLLANFGEQGDLPKPHSNPEVVNCIEAFLRWFEGAGLTPLYVERPLFAWYPYQFIDGSSEDLYWAGTIDLIAKDKDGSFVFVDFKTSKGKFDEHHYQLSAYMEAAFNEGIAERGRRLIVRFPKEGGDVESYDMDKAGKRSHGWDFAAFTGDVILWHQRQAHLKDWMATQDFRK